MKSNFVYAVSLAVLFNCIVCVTNKSGGDIEISSKNVTDRDLIAEHLNENIYSEGNSVMSPSKSRIKPRKGAVQDKSTEIITPSTTANITQDTVNKNLISDVPALPSNTTLSISNVTVPSIITSTSNLQTSRVTSTTPSSSSVKTLATKKKDVKKPTITYSADDNAQIMESEKKIKYINVTNTEDATIGPKTSSDTDRTIVEEEQRTRRNYIVYMGLAFALPLAFTLIHLSYKKIRNWLELREYERVVSQNLFRDQLPFTRYYLLICNL